VFGMPVAPPIKAAAAPAGLSADSLRLWRAATYYRRRADELAVKDSRVSL